MRRLRARKRNYTQAAELNITAFMNLMVILVPFLLITAVFSRMAILELELPPPGDGSDNTEQEFHLELTVRDSGINIAARGRGSLKNIPVKADGHNYTELSHFLQRIKSKFPDKSDATLLLEEDVSYNVLVDVMDTVRSVTLTQDGITDVYPLFPRIAIGDAAPMTQRVAATE